MRSVLGYKRPGESNVGEPYPTVSDNWQLATDNWQPPEFLLDGVPPLT
jgi:hypothetical protein